MEIGENTDASKHFHQYLQVANYTDLDDPLFKELTGCILDLNKEFYEHYVNYSRPKISSYASIVGPSLMGKTQFAFSLARVCPVFYVNFASIPAIQHINEAFGRISIYFMNLLSDDIEVLQKEIKSLNSDDILDKASNIELKTIGFLWELVKYSTEFNEFDHESDSDWFTHYIKSRVFTCEKMTFEKYLQNLSKNHIITLFLLIFQS